MVDEDKNIWFVLFGANPLALVPAGCAIDHTSIDWDTYDLTGGFGDSTTISYNADSFFGVNFFKADNVTPLGVHDTCPNTSTADSIYRGAQYTYLDVVPDSTPGFYKTIFGAWWANTY